MSWSSFLFAASKIILLFAGPSFFLAMQLSLLDTAFKISKIKSTMSLSSLPFISLFTNCIVWTFYGGLRLDFTVLIPNISGAVCGLYCSVIFHLYASEPVTCMSYTFPIMIIALALTLVCKGNFEGLGLMGCVLSIILMGSPLATLLTVLGDKSTKSLPFWTSVTGFLNALSWTLYGWIVANDPMIYWPNMLGLMLATVQLSFFCLYGCSDASDDELDSVALSSVPEPGPGNRRDVSQHLVANDVSTTKGTNNDDTPSAAQRSLLHAYRAGDKRDERTLLLENIYPKFKSSTKAKTASMKSSQVIQTSTC